MDALVATLTLGLVHVSFVASVTFLIWFGITRKWSADDYGVNLFLTTVSIVILLTMAEISLFWEEEPWRAWVRLVGWGILAFVLIQRLWFLVRDTRRNRKR